MQRKGCTAVTRNVLIKEARALILTLCNPRPPMVIGRKSIISYGFFSWSWNNQLLTLLVTLEMSVTRRSTLWHLNQTLLRALEFKDQGLQDKSMNLPDFQALIVLETRVWIISPFTFLVCSQEAFSSTPTISRLSDITIYLRGISSCWSEPLHLPRGRNLHLPAVGSLCRRQPDDFSKREQALSTIKNSLNNYTIKLTVFTINHMYFEHLWWFKN